MIKLTKNKNVESLAGVERVVDYETHEADKSVILTDNYVMQSFRYEYLQNMRAEWEWVDSSKEGTPFVLLKRRS